MRTSTKAVGPAIAEWDEDIPLRWTMTETVGKGKRAELKQFSFDLTPLLQCYGRDFLLALKEYWIERRLQVRLTTIFTDAYRVQAVLQTCQSQFVRICSERSTSPPVFERIDSDLILGLWAVQDSMPVNYLTTFRAFHNKHRHNSSIFQVDLRPSDLPRGGRPTDDLEGLGAVGRVRKSALASALSRATLVQILNITEEAYEAGELSLGIFAFSRLLLSRAARPESFRLLRLKDLQIDEVNGKKVYFLTIAIPKARTAERPLAHIRLHQDVGMILDRQRDAVAKRLADLIQTQNAALSEGVRKSSPYTIGDLPLFPGGGSSGRMVQTTKDRLGMVRNSGDLAGYYITPLKELTGAKISHIALRHTLGTQLAIAGCSASTIAAVLLHATRRSASVYVDLVFSGAIDELSDSLEPAFLEHFPVIKQFVSVKDEIAPAKRIVSLSVERTRRETTGECGRHQICQYAPIACYECPRFKPCYDVDHTINLERVNEEVESARNGGLPRQVDMKRYMHIANRIRVVINICDAKREAIAAERAAEGTAP
jgi:hypothetical protein